MAGLKFTLEADVKKLQELRKEIEKVTVAIGKLPSDSPQIRKLEAQLSKLRKEYDGIETLLSKVQLMGKELAKSEDLIKHTRKQTDETKKATEHFEAEAGSLAALEKQAKSLTKEWLAMSEARKQSDAGQGKVNELAKVNAQIKIEKDNLRTLQKEYVNTQKIQDLQEGSIKSLRAELSNLNAVYDSLGRSQRKGAYGKELLNGIQTVYKELVEAEQASGRFQRVVGNYASAFNGLGFSVQQVARELPSLAINANTFFLAISNNIPILVDEIAKARKEYANFKAELKAGNKDVKAVAPVWQQLTKSILSWQTALVVGLTLLSVYGKDVIKWVSSLGKARDVTLDLLSAEQEMALARKSAWGNIAKEQTQLDILYNKLKNVTLSTTERNAAVREWVKNYKTHSDILDGENVDLRKLENAYKALSKEIYANAVARAYADRIAELSVQREKEEMKRLNQKLTITKAEQELERVTAEYNKKENEGFGTATAKLEAKDRIIQARKNVEDQKKIYNDLVNNINDYDKNITVISNHIKTLDLFPQPKEGTYDYWQQQVEIADNALKQIQDSYLKVLKSGSTQGVPEEVAKQYNALIKQKTEAEEKLKIYNDKELSKEYNSIVDQNQKISELRSKSTRERIRLEVDLESQAEQARIDAMQDGFDKEERQRKLNNKKELEAIERQKQDYINKVIDIQRQIFEAEENAKASKDKNYKKQVFNLSSVSVDTSMFDIIKDETLKRQTNEVTEYYNDILSKYQDYLTKRLNTEKRFNADRDKLQKSGASDTQLNELEYQRTEALNSIDKEFAMREDSFQSWANSITELSLKELQRLLVEAERELERMEFVTPNSSGLATQRAKVNTLKQQISDVNNKNTTSPDKRSVKDWQDLYKTLSKVEKEFNEIGDTVGGTAGEIMSAAGSISSSTLQMIDGIVTLANSSSTAMSGTAKAASTAIQTVEKASVILAIVGAALQVATKIISLFKQDDGIAAYEKAKETYESYIEVLDKVIDKQLELAETLSGENARAAYKEAINLIQQQSDAAKELGKAYLNSGASKGFLGIGSKASRGRKEVEEMSAEGWTQAAKALGISVREFKEAMGGRMTGLFDLTEEQLVNLQKYAPSFWAQLDKDTKDYANQIVDGVEQIMEVLEQEMENATGVSWDSFSDDILEALYDVEKGAEDIFDDMSEYMRKAMIKAIYVKQYEPELRKWYEMWANYMDDGILSDDERIRLDALKENIINGAMNEADRINKAWGSSSSSSQESTKKGFAAASQDSIEELNGRFTALQIAGEEIKNQSVEQTRLLDSINSILLNIGPSQASFSIPDLSLNREALNRSFATDIAMRAESNAQLQAAIVSLTGEVQTIKNNVGEMLTFSAEDRINQQTIAENSSSLNKNLPKITQTLDSIKQNTNGLSRR